MVGGSGNHPQAHRRAVEHSNPLKVELSRRALRDLLVAADEVSDRSVPSALRLLDEWDAMIDRLETFPEMGHRHDSVPRDFLVTRVLGYLAV